jgi:hypothetical protein
MLKAVLGLFLMAGQLSGPGGGLPQVLHPEFKPAAPVKAGKRAEVIVSFTAIKGYVVDRELPFTLKLSETPGVTLEKSEVAASGKDPKSKDNYYVDLPTLKVGVTAAKAGKYEVPGKLKYFFCNKADGFCSTQTLDVKIPVQAE